jgi:organic radical activating enzyme
MHKVFWMQPEDTVLGRWQKTVEDKTGSKTFCVLPWTHLATRPNGDTRLCCGSNSSGAGDDHEIGLVRNDSGEISNLNRDTPLEIWNNKYMRDVRTTMIAGEIPVSCTKCFDEESKNIVSKRMWENSTWISEGLDVAELAAQTTETGVVPEKIVYLDLRLGHTCNLKCIMCSPHDSSKWVADYKKVYPLFKSPILKSQMHWDQTRFNNKWHENPNFWREIYEQIPNLKQVYFAGGEPLMIKEHKQFLEEIIKRGYQSQILLRYNTNGILVDDEIIKLWTQFKKVKVAISLDATDIRNFYIRYPTNWNDVVTSLHKLDNSPSNIHVSVATAIQILNIMDLPAFAKWKIQQNFKKINLQNIIEGMESGGGIINMHLLYIPTFLSIKCLPESDKIEVRKRFADFASWLYANYRQDLDFWKKNPYGWKRWQAILDFMDADDQTNQLPAFSEYITTMDITRKTNFAATFPELAHLVAQITAKSS